MKKISLLLAACLLCTMTGCAETSSLAPLPSPEPAEGLRGEQFGIDKNINEETIDQYLGRQDSVYRDMRMLKDEAAYEAIGGDSMLSGYVEGFEIVPYPYLVNVEGLPAEVGSTYSGPTLYSHDDSGYHANYEESEEILEYLFPKDKNIFLMCGGGGYAGMMKNMLGELGWDTSKIYNTGGFWFYQGEHAVSLKREENGKVFYDFYKAPYHYLDFSTLHALGTQPADGGSGDVQGPVTMLKEITPEEVSDMLADGRTFALSLYLPGCGACAGFAPLAKEFADAGSIEFYSLNFTQLKEIEGLETQVSYTPAVILIREGKISAVLSPDKDADTPYFKSTKALSEWFHEHAGTPLVDGSEVNGSEDCDTGCRVDFACDDLECEEFEGE